MQRDESLAFSERIAKRATDLLGSMRFIIAQTIVIAFWITSNIWGFVHWDPMPFILLNLLFSTQAAYAAPLILLAQNRQAERDRRRDDREADEMEEVDQLQREQMQHLREHSETLALLQDDRRLLHEIHAEICRLSTKADG